MSTLSEKILSFVQKSPLVQSGIKISPENAEKAIWKGLSDQRIGVLKEDEQTHQFLNPDFISEKDFRTVFCDEMGFALPCVRMLMKEIISSSKVSADETKKSSDFSVSELIAEKQFMDENSSFVRKTVDALKEIVSSNKPIGQYKTTELLEKYTVDSPQEIWDELKKRSNGLPCIIFEDGKLNVKLSNGLIQDIRKGHKTTSVYNDGENFYRVYCIGCFPEDFSYVCPITGKILQTNFYSSELGLSWSGIVEECLVLIHIIAQKNPEVRNKMVAKMLAQSAKCGFEKLRHDWSEEALVYDELKKLNDLPSLRVSRGSMATGRAFSHQADPFGSPRRS